MRRRVVSACLAVALLCSLCTVRSRAASYTDVQAGSWYYGAVTYALDNGLMYGVGDNRFLPGGTMTRAMFVTLLGRLSGVDAELYSGAAFSDVPEREWYSIYVKWAADTGLVNGYGGGVFGLNDPITREQMAAILARYLQQTALSLGPSSTIAALHDAGSVSPWAAEGVETMREIGIIAGDQSGNYAPQRHTTRAEAATVFMRLHQQVAAQISARGGSLEVDGVSYTLGMPASTLQATAGAAAETATSTFGFTWCIYPKNDYASLLLVGVAGDQVVALVACGTNFVYQGMGFGSQVGFFVSGNHVARVYEDPYNQNSVFMAAIYNSDYFYAGHTCADDSVAAIAGESRAIFHLTNAYRKANGLNTLVWSDIAASAALQYSKAMADNQFFSHTGQDGSEFTDRLRAAGLELRDGTGWSAGENLDAGYNNAVRALVGWVKSEGHRENLLGGTFSHVGVGGAHNAADTYEWRFSQEFYHQP